MSESTVSPGAHTHSVGAPGWCLVTKEEAAELAERSTRTIELWAEQGLITKFTVGPTGYWVRFCREEIRTAKDAVRVASTPSASAASASG